MLIQRDGDYIRFIINGQVRGAIHRTCTMNLSQNGQGIEIVSKDGAKYTIYYKNVLQTQVLPSAAVNFSGTLRDLWGILALDFVDELHQSVAPAPMPNPKQNFVLVNGTYNANVNEDPLLNDQNIIATGALTVNLPATTADILAIEITICANSNDVTILPNGTDLILSETSCEIAGLDSITLICFQVGKWIAK